MQNNSKEFSEMLLKEYNLGIKDKWGECYLREAIKCNDLCM